MEARSSLELETIGAGLAGRALPTAALRVRVGRARLIHSIGRARLPGLNQ
jgi:hypothetical protein